MADNIRSQFFGMMLYPQEDKNHVRIIEYIKEQHQMGFYEYVYIEHKAESEDKKDHVHMMYKRKTRVAVVNELKFWAGWVDHVEPIYDPSAYVMYMLHKTPQARAENKIPYLVPDLVTSSHKFLGKLIGNSNFIEFGEVLRIAREVGGDIMEMLEYISEHENGDALLEVLQSHNHLFVAGCNQLYNRGMKGVYKIKNEPLEIQRPEEKEKTK